MIFFETIKCKNYNTFNISYHKARVVRTIGLNINIEEYIYPPNKNKMKCNIIYDENEILFVEYKKYDKKVIKSFYLIYDNDIKYDKKFLNRNNINTLYEKRGDCDEIIIVKNKLITDTSIANIAIKYNQRWITPAKPLHKGTTRQRLIESKQLYEKDISVDMLKNSEKIALLNAMIGFDKNYNKDMICPKIKT